MNTTAIHEDVRAAAVSALQSTLTRRGISTDSVISLSVALDERSARATDAQLRDAVAGTPGAWRPTAIASAMFADLSRLEVPMILVRSTNPSFRAL